MRKLFLSSLVATLLAAFLPVTSLAQTTYESNSEVDDGVAIAILIVVLGVYCVFCLAIYLFSSYLYYRIAKKTDVADKAWWAFLPIMQTLLFLDIAKMSYLYFFLTFVPFVNFVVGILMWIKILKNLGKPDWHIILIFIPFTSIFYLIYLAFEPKK